MTITQIKPAQRFTVKGSISLPIQAASKFVHSSDIARLEADLHMTNGKVHYLIANKDITLTWQYAEDRNWFGTLSMPIEFTANGKNKGEAFADAYRVLNSLELLKIDGTIETYDNKEHVLIVNTGIEVNWEYAYESN